MTQTARVSHAGACALLLLLLLLLLHPPNARCDASWFQFPSVPSPAGLHRHQALTHSGTVVIIGGCSASGAALPNVLTFDPSTGSSGTWTQRSASANLPLMWHSASALQAATAVVFGGVDVASGNYSAKTYKPPPHTNISISSARFFTIYFMLRIGTRSIWPRTRLQKLPPRSRHLQGVCMPLQPRHRQP